MAKSILKSVKSRELDNASMNGSAINVNEEEQPDKDETEPAEVTFD